MLEIRRQAIHLVLFGLCAFFVIYLPLSVTIPLVSFFLAVSILAGSILKFRLEERFLPEKLRIVSRLFKTTDKARSSAKKFPFYGSIIGLAGILASLLIVGSRAYIPILVLAWGDSASTLVGIYLGKTRLIKGRSLEGAIGFFLAACIPLFLATPLSDSKVILIALVGTLTEIFSPVDDNLSIPIATSLFLRFFA